MPSTKQIIKHREIVADHWQAIGMDDDLPAGDIIVPVQRWYREKNVLQNHDGKVGVRLHGDDLVEDLVADLSQLNLIAIDFPAFKDGRGYSQARLLRDRYDYKGELRAVGNILRDQLFYLQRCGFDAYELESGKDFEDALNGFNDFTIKYQPASDGPATQLI